jgi:hypothetical protein
LTTVPAITPFRCCARKFWAVTTDVSVSKSPVRGLGEPVFTKPPGSV